MLCLLNNLRVQVTAIQLGRVDVLDIDDPPLPLFFSSSGILVVWCRSLRGSGQRASYIQGFLLNSLLLSGYGFL